MVSRIIDAVDDGAADWRREFEVIDAIETIAATAKIAPSAKATRRDRRIQVARSEVAAAATEGTPAALASCAEALNGSRL